MFIRFPCHAIYVNRYSVYTSYSCAIIPNTQGETPARLRICQHKMGFDL